MVEATCGGDAAHPLLSRRPHSLDRRARIAVWAGGRIGANGQGVRVLGAEDEGCGEGKAVCMAPRHFARKIAIGSCWRACRAVGGRLPKGKPHIVTGS